MEIITRELDPATLQAELTRIADWLERRGICQVQVTLGVGAVIPPDELWRPIALQVADLYAFVEDAAARGVFQFGRTDLHIYDAATFVRTSERTFRCDYPGLTFTVCHESDLHFSADDPAMVEGVKQDWILRGYSIYESKGQAQLRS